MEVKLRKITQQIKPKKLRILIISHMYPSRYQASSGIFVHEQVKALQLIGYDVRVVSALNISKKKFLSSLWASIQFFLGFKNLQWKNLDGVSVIYMPNISPRILRFFPLYFLSCHLKMRLILQDFPVDIVHAHTALLDGTIARKIFEKYQIPYVITEHTGPFSLLTKKPYFKNKTEKAILHAKKIMPVSASLMHQMNQTLGFSIDEKSSILPNIVNVDQFNLNSKIRNKDEINMLWVGHFVAIKRVPDLIYAFKTLVDNGLMTNLRLNLVSGGGDETTIRNLVEELNLLPYVRFLGYADRQRLVEIYQQNDFLVISSEAETFGVVGIEALSCGLPVLTTACGGPESYIRHQDLGLVVEHSIEAMAQGMKWMIANLDGFDRHKIRAYAVEHFSREVVSKRLDEEYQKMMMEA